MLACTYVYMVAFWQYIICLKRKPLHTGETLKDKNFMNFMTENRLKKVNCELANSDSLHYHSLGTLLKGFWKVQISLLLSYACMDQL